MIESVAAFFIAFAAGNIIGGSMILFVVWIMGMAVTIVLFEDISTWFGREVYSTVLNIGAFMLGALWLVSYIGAFIAVEYQIISQYDNNATPNNMVCQEIVYDYTFTYLVNGKEVTDTIPLSNKICVSQAPGTEITGPSN